MPRSDNIIGRTRRQRKAMNVALRWKNGNGGNEREDATTSFRHIIKSSHRLRVHACMCL